MEFVNRFRLHAVFDDHPGLQFAMPLVSVHDDELLCIGTAFPVCPGLAITAAHVVREWKNYQERKDGYRRPEINFSVVAFQLFEGKVLEWHVDAAYCLWTGDIAFLRFLKPSWWGDGEDRFKPRCVRLNVNPPVAGTEIRVFGFPNSFVKDRILYVSPAECTARVREVVLNSPYNFRPTSYVELDGEILAGMSGGPCFDADWNVVGMCSKGWNFIEDVEDCSPLSYMGLLWPAMSLPIDPWKTGEFPAWNFFKQGPAQAVGHRRVEVTSTGETLIGSVDPEALKPVMWSQPAERLEGALNFAAESARQALVYIKTALEVEIADGESWNMNSLITALRHFFWELDSAIRLAMRVAAAKVGFTLPCNFDWDQFVHTWQNHGAGDVVIDRLKALGFSWNGVLLFEIRTYAVNATYGTILAEVLISKNRIVGCMLEKCREGGDQVNVPDGLNGYFDAARRFSQGILRLASQQSVESREMTV